MARDYCFNCGTVGCNGCEPVRADSVCVLCGGEMYIQYDPTDGKIIECDVCSAEINVT